MTSLGPRSLSGRGGGPSDERRPFLQRVRRVVVARVDWLLGKGPPPHVQQIRELRGEIAEMHRAILQGWAGELLVTPWRESGARPTAPDVAAPAEAKLAHCRRELAAALDELEFRTRQWRAMAEGTGPVPPYDHGFVLPDLVASPGAGHSGHYVKRFQSRPTATGLTARQAFVLEARCLMRLQTLSGAARHFPAPVAFAPDDPSITLSHVGWSLDSAEARALARRLRLPVQGYFEQIDSIVEGLERASVVHLDLLQNARNVLLAEDGRLSLVDFDIAVIDDQPFSAEIQRRHDEWNAGGRFARTRRQLVRSVERFLDAADKGV